MPTIKKSKIGLFGIGLDAYWNQFPDLLDRLLGYQSLIKKNLEKEHSLVVDAGMVDNVEKAKAAADLFRREDVDMIFLYVSTYALSSTVLPVVQKIKVPVIILNLQPTKAIDYKWFNGLGDRGLMTGEWLANCQACSVPEIASVFNRAGISFNLITGFLDDKDAWGEIHEWIEASDVVKTMQNNRFGILGNYYGGMLDVYSDLTLQSVSFGTHIEIIEMCELKKLRDRVTQEEIENKIKQIHSEFEVMPDCDKEEIKRAAKTSCALDKLVVAKQIGSLAYYYEGVEGNEYQDIVTSIITGNSILTAQHVPVAGEMEVKNVQAMKIMDCLNAGGSFSEFYGMDFAEDIVLMGHDGPGHLAIAEGKPRLKPLGVYHGKPGKGLSVEMKVKYGHITALSVVQTPEGKLKLLVAEGKSVPGPILEIGNTNSRYKFSIGVKSFINNWSKEGPSHHCAIGIGHVASKIKKIGSLLNMEVIQVC
ncbi:MAG: L-fucose/L-arabinose isomerase family protein [Bacteroidetes bacterium]|nr:L-fucose/L-arabinose isomerase family protein [Bacteroidota bacterium]